MFYSLPGSGNLPLPKTTTNGWSSWTVCAYANQDLNAYVTPEAVHEFEQQVTGSHKYQRAPRPDARECRKLWRERGAREHGWRR